MKYSCDRRSHRSCLKWRYLRAKVPSHSLCETFSFLLPVVRGTPKNVADEKQMNLTANDLGTLITLSAAAAGSIIVILVNCITNSR